MKSISVDKILNKIEAEKKAPKKTPVIKRLKEVVKKATPEKSKVFDSIEVSPKVQKDVDEFIISLDELHDEMAAVLRQRAKLSSGIYHTVYGRSSDYAIDIGTVLNKIDTLVDENTNEVRTFGIRFLSDNGQLSEMLQCRKNVKDPRRKLNKPGGQQERGKFKYNLKQKGTILLTSPDKPYRSVLVSCIYEFQDFKSRRWLRVRH